MNIKHVFSSRRGLLVLALFILLPAANIFSQTTIVNDVIIVPSYPLDPLPNKVLVLSTVDLKERFYQRYTHNASRKIAAKANYNCAVLMEQKQRPHEAKLYLQESLGLFLLVDAMMLKQDYGITTGWRPLPNE